MIRTAEWDSEFFEYPVGKLYLEKKENLRLEEFKSQSKNYSLIYVFSEVELDDFPGLRLIDKKVTYSKEIQECAEMKDISDFNMKSDSYDQLLNLAYLSGKYSRFKKDENFHKGEFEILYRNWLNNSIDKNSSYRTLVKKSEGEIAGFITLNKVNSITSEIGLIAVNEKFQGRQIGSILLKQCEFLCCKGNIQELKVATQWENIPARRLYEKNDFGINKIMYIYHYWNL